MPRRALFFLWMAASLTTMFFYPLVSAMSDDLLYLQWQRADTYVFSVNFVGLAAAMALLLWWARGGSPHKRHDMASSGPLSYDVTSVNNGRLSDARRIDRVRVRHPG